MDRRGKSSSKNKTDASDEAFLREFMMRFPTFESRFGNNSDSALRYLAPTLNATKMYKEYREVCAIEKRKVLSDHMFRRIFHDETFRFAQKKLSKGESCKVCEEFEKLSQENGKDRVPEQFKVHNESAVLMKNKFIDDVMKSKESIGKIQCLTFQLQRALETPSLSTGAAYFKRPLWTNNLCIYNEVDAQAFMYVWSEHTAGRGIEEIASGILYHLKNQIPSDTRHIILYSDASHVNRCFKLTLFLKKFLSEASNIESIEQKFFVSGHSYNNCDNSFASIDRRRRACAEEVYSLGDWVTIIKDSKRINPKCVVTVLTGEHFFSCKSVEDLVVKRKLSVTDEMVKWPSIPKIINSSSDPFTLVLDIEHNRERRVIDISKPGATNEILKEIKLDQLPLAKVSRMKYNDLMDLLKYIPAVHHQFYFQIFPSDEIQADYGLVSDYSDDEGDF